MPATARSGEGTIRRLLLGLIAAEVVVFSLVANHFATVGNAMEVLRQSIEVGLLAVALTPVIVAGGIDLSVGPLMGLSAVAFGLCWRDLGLPIVASGAVTLALGLLAGGLNGLLVTRLKIPPLIVTLGSFSLFRGVAEGLTGGTDNVTDFPPAFLAVGQGYAFGVVPNQLPIFFIVAAVTWLVLSRGTIGRALVAIGFSPEGARHAGLPVRRLVAGTYAASGLVASLAAILYVAHLGQAKADAGTGYEVLAITAVVLGGTSIFGGRGSVEGTLLGLLAIAILQNGLRLADLPAEFAGIMTGVLLLSAIGLDRLRPRGFDSPTDRHPIVEGFTMKNAQVAVICLAVLLAGAIVAGSNVYLVRSILDAASRRDAGKALEPVASSPETKRPTVVAIMPKSKGNAYFIACRKGAEEAAREAGVTLVWDGPTEPDPAKQNEVIDTWITRRVDVIAVAVENRQGISSVLRKARSRGIKVVTWDSDADPDARDFFVNQATPEGIGRALMDAAARVMGGEGEFAIITGSLTAANMNEWQRAIEARRAAAYPKIRLAALRPCDDLQKKAFDETSSILNAMPKVKLVMAICTPAVPGAAEAVKLAGRADVKVIGLGLPNNNKRFVHEGITPVVVLWKTADLGYLAVLAAKGVVDGTLRPGEAGFVAGRLGRLAIEGTDILLGTPFEFTEENIDQFDF